MKPAHISGAGTIFRLGAQLTFVSVVHDREKPKGAPNLVFSPVLSHLLFTLQLFIDKNETKIYKVTTSLFGLTVWGQRPHGPKLGASCPYCPLPVLVSMTNNRVYEVTSG